MRFHLLTLLLLAACAVSAHGQTIKSLGYNTTNGNVVYAGTNKLRFINAVDLATGDVTESATGSTVDLAAALWDPANDTYALEANDGEFQFNGTNRRDNFRSALGLGATWLTNNNVTNFRSAIGLGVTNDVNFNSVTLGAEGVIQVGTDEGGDLFFSISKTGLTIEGDPTGPDVFELIGTNLAPKIRANLGLGATNNVLFNSLYVQDRVDFFGGIGAPLTKIQSGSLLDGSSALFVYVTNQIASRFTATNFSQNGNITINQTATNNGLLFIYRTNNESFLGLANLIASNNTTISNETLFRVGVSEATNKAAQFGFRSTNTNGNGVAVFSVFGYNALMMIGPSDPAAGTNPIQATVYSVAPTNKVMTLITTNTGAMLMHRPIGIDTAGVSTNAPANTTNVAGWIQFYVGTNSVRVPYYQ
jgi:hypothetical protein